jgi:hypothetical protein
LQVNEYVSDELEGVVGDDRRDPQRDGRVEPVDAADDEDDGAAGRDAYRRCPVGEGVQHHRAHVEVDLLDRPDDERAASHNQASDNAHDHDRQALDVWCDARQAA